jgi:hypothetical protein
MPRLALQWLFSICGPPRSKKQCHALSVSSFSGTRGAGVSSAAVLGVCQCTVRIFSAQTSGSGGREAKYTDSHLLVVLPGWRQREQSTPSHAYLAQNSTVFWGALASRLVVRRIGVAANLIETHRLGHGAQG